MSSSDDKDRPISGSTEKEAFVASTDSPISPIQSEHLHFVSRGDEISASETTSDDQIVGYDRTLMKDRARLSSGEEKKLLRRIDWHLLPLLAAMYMIKTIDAANLSNARIMDRGTPRNVLNELHITSDQYNLVTVAYYIPYIVAEAPFNLLVKYAKPSVWQARVMISWGIVLCCHAAVKNAGGLYTVRALLGFFEAGLWPGILLQLCYWYRPDELAKRVVLVTVFGTFSGVISGVLAFAFNGVHARGLSGWKWLILTEGMFTIVLGLAVFFFLPNFPADVKWLSEREKSFVLARLPVQSPRDSEKDFDKKQFMTTLKDVKVWLFLTVWSFYTIGTTGLTFYQPTVIANLGYTSIGKAQLLNIPPAVLSSALILVCAWIAHTGRVPAPLIPISYMIVILACYVVEYTYPNTGGVYAATTLAGGFSTAWFTMMWPWRIQTTEGATGSAFAIAFANSYGQIGGAIGPQLFNSRFGPRYTTSFAIAMGFVGLAIIMASITWIVTARVDIETRKMKRARIAAGKRNQAVLDDVDIHRTEKGKRRFVVI